VSQDVSTAPVYSMGVAERLTGLTARQIRYWELHGLIKPSRTAGGHRMYSEADLVRLKEIKRLLSDGMTLERVKAQFAAREEKRSRSAIEMPLGAMQHRIPNVTRSLYTGANRAELQRMLDRKPGK
jgi:MerR family glutamine synthetase transcriptional repressor